MVGSKLSIGARLAMGAVLSAGMVAIGSSRIGPIPPLGPLLDPAHGLWASVGASRPPSDLVVSLPGLSAEARVVVDRFGVPHVFAASSEDGYRILGYLVARDRLFQLELQTRAGFGTLTELVGKMALPLDRRARQLGFPRTIERHLAALDTTGAAYRAIRAYGDGINAWIDRMRPRDLPIEYRLLGRRPARWHPRNTLALFSQMTYTLGFNDQAFLKARAAAAVGWEAADALYPVNAPIQEPIQPTTSRGAASLAVIPPPGLPDSAAATVVALREALGAPRSFFRDEAIGSNNWAVAPSRSATRHALLAGDPHLELTLPSIWYQAHLVVRDSFDVAGVTLPGAPWVIIGLNREIAWSLTNAGLDANDYYLEEVDDFDHPQRYRLDGKWVPLERRIEVYRSPRGVILATDTVRYTHRGPARRAGRRWVSMNWTFYGARSLGNEFGSVNRARSVDEFLRSTADYQGPAQNMLVADRRGSIAIRTTGRIPLRPGHGRGDLLLDGTTRASDWRADWPVDSYPASKDPPRGFLSSANQQPRDPRDGGRYLNANWYSPWRAIRINEILAGDSAMTLDRMRRMQVDNQSARARRLLPFLLAANVRQPDSLARLARAWLEPWGGSYSVDDQRAVLFERTIQELSRLVWNRLLVAGAEAPADAVLVQLLHDPANPWWNVPWTDEIERRDDLIDAALAAAWRSVTAEYGPPGPDWRWGRENRINIHHLLRLPPFSALGLEVPYGPGTISPASPSGSHGASWRMVVELGDPPVALGIYPGGQSGNPLSKHYRDRLDRWLAGSLDTILTPAAPDRLDPRQVESRLTFKPGSRR